MVRSTASTTSANAREAASAGTTASTIQNPSVALTWSDEKESGRYTLPVAWHRDYLSGEILSQKIRIEYIIDNPHFYMI